jgi:hypothetical protein
MQTEHPTWYLEQMAEKKREKRDRAIFKWLVRIFLINTIIMWLALGAEKLVERGVIPNPDRYVGWGAYQVAPPPAKSAR